MNLTNIQTKWDLKKYYYESITDSNYIKDKLEINQKVDLFIEKYNGKICRYISPEQIKQFYDDEEQLNNFLTKIYLFVSYLNSLNTQDQEIIKELSEIEVIFLNINEKLLFIDQEFKELGYDKLVDFANSSILEKYKNNLITKANNLKYLLDENSEQILNKKSLPISQFTKLFSELHNSFVFELEIDGEIKKLTENEIRSYRYSCDENIRKNAQQSLRKVYGQNYNQICLGNIYSGIVKDWSTDIQLRKYSTVMEPRNIKEQLDNRTVNCLIDTVIKSTELFKRFIRIKRKFLKKDILEVHNLYASLGEIENKYSFEQAVELHLKAMKNFDEEFYRYSLEMLEDSRVDVLPAYGKRGGAFASYSKGHKSMVLLNFTGNIEEVSTLSHELGHAIHGYFSQNLPACTFESPLSLAETASIFNELLLSDYLKQTISEDQLPEFYNLQLSRAFASIFRQIQYIYFERIVHEKILNGEGLSFKDFNKIWRQTQEIISGQEIIYDVLAEEESTWSMIPHIFRTPFYCYAYAFGNILSYSLFGIYKLKGDQFIQDYKNILRAGGSYRPKELLLNYGLDIDSEEFYMYGLNEIETILIKMESLEIK